LQELVNALTDDDMIDLMNKMQTYDKNKDFTVAECKEKYAVIEVVEQLFTYIKGKGTNLLRDGDTKVYFYSESIGLDFVKDRGCKWNVSYRSAEQDFFLALELDGTLKGHLYSDTADVHASMMALGRKFLSQPGEKREEKKEKKRRGEK
jgi:hypothetical protein